MSAHTHTHTRTYASTQKHRHSMIAEFSVCCAAACATTVGVGHKLGPRGAYATRGVDGAALDDIEECCAECSADWRCRTFTFFEHTCYMYEGVQGNDDNGDVIACPGCVFGVASGTGSVKVCACGLRF